jgi:hypothetical protein
VVLLLLLVLQMLLQGPRGRAHLFHVGILCPPCCCQQLAPRPLRLVSLLLLLWLLWLPLLLLLLPLLLLLLLLEPGGLRRGGGARGR